MIFQPADEFHGASSKALDGFLEIRQSLAAFVLGVLVPVDEDLRFAYDLIRVRLRPRCLILRGIYGFACPLRRASGRG